MRHKLSTARAILREEGLWGVGCALRNRVEAALPASCYVLLPSLARFTCAGRRYRYLHHPYNATWRNERAVELPLFRELLRGHAPGRVLEVGNVLSHYVPVRHTVVDKYEIAPGVLNHDVVDYRPERPLDLILSISTLEHVGFDEQAQEPDKPLLAVAHLTDCLAPGGVLAWSFGLGHNRHLDALLDEGRVPFDERWCLRRVGRGNRWVEATWAEIRGIPYDTARRSAAAVTVLFSRR